MQGFLPRLPSNSHARLAALFFRVALPFSPYFGSS